MRDMINSKTMETANPSDVDLVAQSLAGNREAFARIVCRYQSLICSLTYSATGSLTQSEDLAQETFLTAWKQLAGLREPEKLRNWLCVISRNLAYDALNKQRREPSHAADPLDSAHDSPAPEPMPPEQVMSREEQEILWRSIERIPETYREPLVLFYREHQSVEAVAQNLELSEDAVKQRLSRGRKLLQEQVLAFVEGALERTNPGKAFTLAVLAALPALTISAKAATIGATAAKGSATAKAAGAMGLFAAILAPILFFFGNYASYRMSLDEAHSDEERGRVKWFFRTSLLFTLAFSLVLAVPLFWACRNLNDPAFFWGTLINGAIVIYFLTLCTIAFGTIQARRRYLARLLADECGGNFPPAAYEYRSQAELFGLPLVHIRVGDRFDVLRGPVKAWIAVGSSHAVGVIFASGGIAVAPLSFGGIAIGLLSFGAIATGMFSLGACSVGVWAYGALAIGWQAFGACALAWNAAQGGVAIAHSFALGGHALAAQANNEIAGQFIQQSMSFRCAQIVWNHGFLVLMGWTIPLILQARIVARARRRREQGNP
jgi:RNA polymerase sigma factor (sigma-70 family)